MKMNKLKNRKNTRLKEADYNRNAIVFLTICTKERQCILSRIVETGVVPQTANYTKNRPLDNLVGTVEDAGPYNSKFYSCALRINIQKIL